MQGWVMVAFAAIYPTDSLGVILIIAIVCSVVGMEANNTDLSLDHHPRLPRDILLHVVRAVGQAVLQSLT